MEERRLGLEIKRTSNLMKRKMRNSVCENDNLTGNHEYILGFLFYNRKKDIYQKDIEKEYNIRRSTATGMLNIMEKNNLIKRLNNESDGRLKKIVLTEKGIKRHLETDEKIIQFEEEIKKGISEKELNKFFLTLDKINKNLKDIKSITKGGNYDKEINEINRRI